MKTLFMLLPLTLVPLLTSAQFAGDFKYVGLEVEASGGTNTSWGDTKAYTVEFSDVSASISNTFSGTFNSYRISRSMSDQLVSSSEDLYYTDFNTQITNETESFGGDFTVETNLVMNVIDEEGSFPFFFSADTNVALSINNITDEMYNEYNSTFVGLGILMRKPTAMTKAHVAGPYSYISIGNGFKGLSTYGWGNIDSLSFASGIVTFDASGSLSITASQYLAERHVTDVLVNASGDSFVSTYCDGGVTNQTTVKGSFYGVDSSGAMSIAISLTESINMQVSSDANLIAGAFPTQGTNEIGHQLFIAVRNPTNFDTNSAAGVYYMAEFDHSYEGATNNVNFNSFEVNRNYIFLNADHTFEIRSDTWQTDHSINNMQMDISAGPTPNIASFNQFYAEGLDRIIEFENGNYSVDTTGLVTLMFSDGETNTAQFSENGQIILLGYGGEDDVLEEEEGSMFLAQLVGIGIKRTAPPEIPSLINFNNDIDITSTGLVMTATGPADWPVEAIYTDDLLEGNWYSAGIITNSGGTIHIVDPGVTNNSATFYNSTFVPW